MRGVGGYFQLRRSQNFGEDISINHRVCTWNISKVHTLSMYKQPNGGRAYGAPFCPKGSIKAINLLDHVSTTDELPSL